MTDRDYTTGLTPEQFRDIARLYGDGDERYIEILTDAAAKIAGETGLSVGIAGTPCRWRPDGAEWTTLCVPDSDDATKGHTFLTPDGQYSLLHGAPEEREEIVRDAARRLFLQTLGPGPANEPPPFDPADKLGFVRELAAFYSRIPGMKQFQATWFVNPETGRQHLAILDPGGAPSLVRPEDYADITDMGLTDLAKLLTDTLKEEKNGMIIAFTGAGISAPSGIPTFQTQPGIRDKLTRTYADRHPDKFRAVLDDMIAACQKAEPNDAHLAIAEAGTPVITMNVDGLHKRAGSEKILQVHGNLFDGNIVLYGDPAPLYAEAESWVYRLGEGDLLLIAGTSYYTGISRKLKRLALSGGADVIEVNDDAEHKVREVLDANRNLIESFEDFVKRTDDLISKAPPMPGPYSDGWEMP